MCTREYFVSEESKDTKSFRIILVVTVLFFIALYLICIPASALTYTTQNPPDTTGTYVVATTSLGSSFVPNLTMNQGLSLTGTYVGTQWLSSNKPNRFNIDLGSAKIIRRLYYENSHAGGLGTTSGVYHFTMYGSNSASSFSDPAYASDTGWTNLTLPKLTMDQHVAADTTDPKYILIENTVAYRYYSFKFADNYAGDVNMGVRRMGLQTEDGYDSGPPNSITNLANTTTCENVTFTWTNPTNADYSHLYNLWDNAVQGNLTNSTTTKAFTPAAGTHTFSTKTVSLSYNMNATWVNQSVVITACPTPTPTPTPTTTATPTACSATEIPTCGAVDFFFWNDSSTLGPTYSSLSKYPQMQPDTILQQTVSSSTGEKTIGSFVTEPFLTDTTMAPGLTRFRTYLNVSSAVGVTKYEFIPFNVSSTGVETRLWYGTARTEEVNELDAREYDTSYARRNYTFFNEGDRLLIRVNVSTTSVTARTAYFNVAGNTKASMASVSHFICCYGSSATTTAPTTAPGIPNLPAPPTGSQWPWWLIPLGLLVVVIWIVRS